MSLRQRAINSAKALGNSFERRRHPAHFILTDKTPWREVYRDGIMSVRHYSLPAGDSINVEGNNIPVQRPRHLRPLLLVPALGIHSWTFDIMPSRSMVRYLMARGHDVYLIDWGAPSQSEHNIDLDTYVNHWMPLAVDAVRRHADAPRVNLVGYCMGGLLSLMYLGGHTDAPVGAIATIASPVNFHKSGTFGRIAAIISRPAMKANEWLRVYIDPLDSSLFHVPGKLVSLGFKLTNPPGVVSAYLDLIRHSSDRDYVTEHMTMGQWFNDMVDYPGATVREVIAKMLLGNNMASGKIQIGTNLVSFDAITQDLLAIAGETDNICTLAAAREIMHLTRSQEKRFEVVPGGHAGVFAGSRAPTNSWRIIADWLSPRAD